MKFKENDVVRIMTDDIKDVEKGEVGVVLMAFDKSREAYEVEILDQKGAAKTQCTLLPGDLEPIWIRGA